MPRTVTPLRVVIEASSKRTFASAVDWPGWSRSGPGAAAALEALAAYADRYAAVATEAGISLPRIGGTGSFTVIEELRGNATTDFGAPGIAATVESEPINAPNAVRIAGLLAAAWVVFDRVVAATPPILRKGPRGGGRDRDVMTDHVFSAEHAYAGKLGVRLRQPSRDDETAIVAVREALLEVVRADRTGEAARPGGWSPRYGARRIAWHALDHAWEMEDRSTST